MSRHEMNWDELGAVWRATTLDQEALVTQLQARLKRQRLFRRLEIGVEILSALLAVFLGVLFWLNLRDEGLWRQIAFELVLLVFVAACFAASWWTRRGTGGEAQTLTAMIDLTIARAQSTRRRVTAFALTGGGALLWSLAAWFLMLPGRAQEEDAHQRAMTSLTFIVLWCTIWSAGAVAWAWWRWRRERQVLAQFLEIRRLLQ